MVNAARQSPEWTDKLMSINSFNHIGSIVMQQELMRIEKDHLIEIAELQEKLELCQRDNYPQLVSFLHDELIDMQQELIRIEKDYLIEISELQEKLELYQRKLINANDALQKITEGKNQ